MHTLLLVLAGGAIGTLLVWSARLLAVPLELNAHDWAVRELDADLKQWVADDHVRLKREVQEVVNGLHPRGLFHSGELGYQVGLAKERALQAYRDQERRAQREAWAVHYREAWAHLLYRKLARRPFPDLEAPDAVQPVLDLWRAPVRRHLSENDTPHQPDDPTRRTLEDAVRDAAANPTTLT